jgi:hypothetical protein
MQPTDNSDKLLNKRNKSSFSIFNIIFVLIFVNVVFPAEFLFSDEPKSITPASDSSCVRIEMENVAEIPVQKPMIPISESNIISDRTQYKVADGKYLAWIEEIRIAAIIIAAIACLIGIISVMKKKKSRPNNETKNIKTINEDTINDATINDATINDETINDETVNDKTVSDER